MSPHLQLLNTNFNVCATNVSPLYNLMVSMRVFRLDISPSSVAILIPDEVKKTNSNALSLLSVCQYYSHFHTRWRWGLA